MSNHLLRILSIDFDVFQTIPNADILNAFPDGIDLPTQDTCVTWASHYANPDENALLQRIGINKQMMRDTIELIESGCDANTPTMIVNSHKHIYDWIFQHTSDNIDSIKITHLDMHHDMFNKNPELDCGNWISHVKDRMKHTTIKWICNPVSKAVYDLDGPVFKQVNSDVQPHIGQKFDLLFICRSDNWLPPHLDKYFRDFYNQVLEIVETASVERNIMEPRDIQYWVKQMQQILTKL